MGYSKNKKNFRVDKYAGTEYGSIGKSIVITWIMIMFAVFPLVVHDAYFDILQTKFYFYAYVTGGMIIIMFAALFLDHVPMQMYNRIQKIGFIGWWKEEFDFVDHCVMVFWLMSILSTLLAYKHIKAVLLGDYGRYNGLLLLSLYVLAYFFVSRYMAFRRYIFLTFTLVGDLVCIFGITDYFRLNIFGFENKMSEVQIGLFSSTIGNINTFTTYVGFVVAFTGGMFVMSRLRSRSSKNQGVITQKDGEDLRTLLFYYVSMIIGFFALTLGKSDNAYLTILAFFGFLPFVAFRTKFGVRRYVLTLATYLSVIKVIDIINHVYKGPVSGIDGFFLIIINFLFLEVAIVLLWILTAVLYFMAYYQKKKNSEGLQVVEDDAAPKIYMSIWTIFFGAVFFSMLGLLIYANTRSYEELEFLGDLRYYLYFQDVWGTFRGYIWRVTMEEYAKMHLLHKIFGTGPDTFGIYMISARGNEMLRVTRTHFDSAHNEYLHYLVTIGPIALLAYLGILGGVIKRGLSKRNNMEVMPYMGASALLMICYAIQAVVNINLPISTPVMWTFLMIVAGITRADKKSLL